MINEQVKIIYVGEKHEVTRFADPLAELVTVEIQAIDKVIESPQRHAVYFFYNEYFDRFRECIKFLRLNNFPTVYAIDGILEWRNSWEFPKGESCLWTMRPVLSHKAACLGNAQARVLDSWGNRGKCEVVGIPRLDKLDTNIKRTSKEGEIRLLVCTANTPGFTQEQIQNTEKGLIALDNWFRSNKVVNSKKLKIIWRLTGDLDKKLKIQGDKSDHTKEKIVDVIRTVDAVITTPSTVMLEVMLFKKPIAILDFNNCPYYVPAAWNISAEAHIDNVIHDLVFPPEPRLLYQNYILNDALVCDKSAAIRTVELARRMINIAENCRDADKSLTFPDNILQKSDYQSGSLVEYFDYSKLYPQNPGFQEEDRQVLQVITEDLRAKTENYETAIIESKKLNKQNNQMYRVIKHPVIRLAVKLLKIVKSDKSFGQIDE